MMRGACSQNGGQQTLNKILFEIPWIKGRQEDQGARGEDNVGMDFANIRLKRIQLAEDKNQWRALKNAILNLQIR